VWLCILTAEGDTLRAGKDLLEKVEEDARFLPTCGLRRRIGSLHAHRECIRTYF